MNKLMARPSEPLADHLRNVSRRAAAFAEAFSAAEHGRAAGLLHDLGKTDEVFQKRIADDDKSDENKKPHAHHGAAAALAESHWPLAFAVNGHHAGLHNRSDLEKRGGMASEAERSINALQADTPDFAVTDLKMLGQLPDWLKLTAFSPAYRSVGWWATELFTRMLFSALVDADRLVSEMAKDGEPAAAARQWADFDPGRLLDKLRGELDDRAANARSEQTASTDVIAVREQVRQRCETMAAESPGMFALTVPTGGGKTLASMLFALAHAQTHGLRRIIYVIPYLSIIQQTARELKKVFGENMVLEHHSQMADGEAKPKKGKEDEPADELSHRRRLAAENWDAPIIVTTSVQFFESLFSRRPSSARKLHNICKSVVIFDEVQTLPPLMLQPILNVLGELANPLRKYGCSLVFCTATQPALRKSEDLPTGLDGVREIVPVEMARDHFAQLDRVDYDWSPSDQPPLKWDELAEKIVCNSESPGQVLVIVNTRKAARQLHETVEKRLGGREGLFHLSTWMMPAHRLEVLDEVRRRLDPKSDAMDRRCILVSTQCIEAGVDVDFPEVWREFGPYDGIVQAAGRCNRNGRLPGKGKVHIFRSADGGTPKGLYATAISQTELLRKMNRATPTDPASFEDYFRLLYQLSVPDNCAIQDARGHWRFEETDSLFKMIDDDASIPVLVLQQHVAAEKPETLLPSRAIYENADSASRRFSSGKQRGYFTRDEWRQIQPYVVNILKSSLKDAQWKGKLLAAFGNDESVGLWIWRGRYDGGLTGVGLDFQGPIPGERSVL